MFIMLVQETFLNVYAYLGMKKREVGNKGGWKKGWCFVLSLRFFLIFRFCFSLLLKIVFRQP